MRCDWSTVPLTEPVALAASEPLKSGCQSSTVKDAPLVPTLVLKLPVLGLGPSSLPSSEVGTLDVFVVFEPFLAAHDTGEFSST
jgi:hypothetical protein